MKENNKVMFHVQKSNDNLLLNKNNNNNENKINKENRNNLDLFQLQPKNSNNNIINNNNNTNLNNYIKNSKSSNNQNQKYNQNSQNILIFDNNNNVFNSIRNNQILFDHRFVNDKTSPFITFLEEPINFSSKINLTALIENRKGLEEFVEDFNWEYYELILYIASCKMNSEIFDKYNEYIIIYLFDGMKKLNEINFSLEIENNKNKKYSLNKFNLEKNYFYQIKREDFSINSEPEQKLECITSENIFYYECFIYYKLNQCKTIDLTDYKFNNKSIQPLLNVLKFKENLQELNLSCNDIGNEGCYSLGIILRINNNISKLNLTSCKISDLGLLYLLKGMKKKSQCDKYNLEELNLKDNKLGEKSGKYLGEILMNLNKLQILNITNNKLNNKGAEDFFNFYKKILEEDFNILISQSNSNNLGINNLNFNNINMNQSDNLSNLSLSNNYSQKIINNLETLILIDIGISSESCLRILGDIIKMPKCGLRSLILSKNSIGTGQNLNDIIYFLDSLKENKSITELYLLSCNIENNIANKIYEMLKENKALEHLVLYDNKISEQFIFLKLLSLFSDLKENHGIFNNIMKELDLSKNNCHIKINDGFLNIIEELQLSSLDISQNELSRDGIESFKNLANRIGDRLKIIY